KDVGKVAEVFTPERLEELPGDAGIAHVRYPTSGEPIRNDAQPFMSRRPSLALAHNGNLTNMVELDRYLVTRGVHMVSGCDAEPIMLVLADELLKLKPTGHTTDDVAVAVTETMKRLRGSYAVVTLLEVDGVRTLVTFRDPNGIRPAVYGRDERGAWAVASESVSLDVNEFTREGEVPPGGMILLRPHQAPIIRPLLEAPRKHCIFEDIYFARPDSFMAGARVYQRRWDFGERLAKEWKAKNLEADVVVAVPDTSRPAAQAMAEHLGLPHREGFIKNRYSGRSFIMPNQAAREATVRLKLNPIDEIFRGRRVIIVDDSIVRGTTMRRIVQRVRKLEPAEIHVAIFSPPVKFPCFYGIDMPLHEELVAHGADNGTALEARLAQTFGADTVTFLSEEGLREVAGNEICAACFTGTYPIPVDDTERDDILRDRRPQVAFP
ncbi:MAG: amidophosphoribosyltransferase, partial [Myxococcota bacterium]